MTRDETALLLDKRHALTGQPKDARMIDAWHDILANVTYPVAAEALDRCARTNTRIQLPDLFAAMPRREASTHHEPTYTGPILDPAVGRRIARDAMAEQLIANGWDRATAHARATERCLGADPLNPDLGEPF